MVLKTSKQTLPKPAHTILLLLVSHLCLPGNLLGQVVTPVHAPSLSNYLLLSGTIASRTFDWVITQDCVHSRTCEELELPKSLAASRSGLALFEGGMTVLTWYGQHQLSKHGHTKLGRYSQLLSIGETSMVDLHNHNVVKRGK